MLTSNQISLGKEYIADKQGVLNALSFASAQYIYKVLEKHNGHNIGRFNQSATRKLKRTVIHKNAHLDEYFAELLFRAILPPHLKDIEVEEHVLMSTEDDSYAKLSWPNAVVFGIRSEEAKGARPLAFFDEHHDDGSRTAPSCSQLVAEEFLGSNIPDSIQLVLDEVNHSDANRGSHQYNLKNLLSGFHDMLFLVGRDNITKEPITKYLTENWKRALFDSCLASMVYLFENQLLPESLDDNAKFKLEKVTKRSIDYFIANSLLPSQADNFEDVCKKLLYNFRVGNHATIDKAVWKDDNGEVVGNQRIILHYVCYALHKCWGDAIANLIMMHVWQMLFQNQISYEQVRKEVIGLSESVVKEVTSFGEIQRLDISEVKFHPQQRDIDKRKRKLDMNSPLRVYDVSLTNPNFPNVSTVLKSIINADYGAGGNNGFGILVYHDKTLNTKLINVGHTVPVEVWEALSIKIQEIEPDRWFQLKDSKGNYADFILNRTKAHQEVLPTELIDAEYLVNFLRKLT
ncbi:MAG: hypothetical protein WD077_14250 [Bacteroidia bacterium]